MIKNRIWLGIILSIILLLFSINGFTTDYKYTQESGAGFFVGTPDKADALEDTNEIRQIINDLGALLEHSKMDGTYPKDLTTGGTIQIPEAGLKFSNAPVNDDIAAYIAGEMSWQTKAELSIQPLDTALTNISALAYVSPSLIKLTANDTYAVRTLAEVKTDLAYQLSDMSDVGITTPTNKYVLVADGDSWESRALVEADISDFGTYLSDITGESIFDLSDVSADPNADKYPKWDDDPGELVWVDTPGYTNLTSFVDQTAWRLFYSNTDGDVIELALGTDGQYLKSTGATSAPEFDTPAGAGNVSTSGTPVQYDYARFTDATTIEGRSYTEVKTDLAFSSDDLSDVDSIAMLDENEIVTVCWYFHDIVYQEYESDLSTYYPQWGFIRRRDGDPTYIVTTGDILGATTFSGGYNEDPLNGLGAVIRGVAEGTFASGDYPTRLEFLTVPDSSSTLTLRMAIDNAGNIKMGDGAWTNYVNISNLGVLTLEGTANIEGVDATELSYLDGVTSDIQTQIDAKKGKNYYSALGSDHTYSNNADTDSQPVGEAVAFGDLLYPDWTAGEWLKADADLAAKMPGLRIALESKTDGQTCLMLVKGYIRDDDAFEFAGSMVYASVTPGAMSSTAPTETGDQVQRVGVAKSADILFFNPSIDVGEI